jgi:hypothetical protein
MREEISYNGLWWLPEKPDDQITGTLTFNPENGSVLSLIGRFGDMLSIMESLQPEIINGFTTTGKKITLLKCYEVNRSGSFPGMQTSIIHANLLFIGANYVRKEDIKFDKVCAKLKNLDEWLGISGLEIKYDFDNHSTSINYRLPDSIDFEINDNYMAKFNFTAKNPSMSIFNKKAVIEQSAQLIIESKEQKLYDYNDFLNVIFTFQMFLTLATFEASYPLEIEFYSPDVYLEFDSKKFPEPITLYYASSIKSKNKDLIPWDMLFMYQDISTNFQTIIKLWYNSQDKLNSILGLFLNTFYNPRVFNENTFLNLAQALESYHRRFYKNNVLDKSDHKLRIDEIINGVDDKYKEWLKTKLSFSNEPSLFERLTELLSEHTNTTISKMINVPEAFLKNIRDSRNYYTHFDKSTEGKASKGQDLYYLTEKMKVILTCCLLHATGFDKTLIEKLLSRNEFRNFNHLIK